MAMKKAPATVRMERSIYTRMEKRRMEEMKKGNPVATSTISWVSYLVKVGLDNEHQGDTDGS